METKRKPRPDLIRTSVLIREETHEALSELADRGNRPLSREIRAALESYVEQAQAA